MVRELDTRGKSELRKLQLLKDELVSCTASPVLHGREVPDVLRPRFGRLHTVVMVFEDWAFVVPSMLTYSGMLLFPPVGHTERQIWQ